MAIFTREIKSFYVSPLYYILGFIYLSLTGYFFSIEIYYSRLAIMENSIYNIGFFSILFLSVMCMKLIAEERSTGTFEIIMTQPITSLEYVVGTILSGYLGLLLLGSAILGLGLIATSVSKSQLVAAILGVSMALFAYVINWLSEIFNNAKGFLNAVSITTYFSDFTRGMIDIQNVVFFLVWVVACIAISTLFVESYKWH